MADPQDSKADPLLGPQTDSLRKPSSAYKQAIAMPVYRLSELMFGSLLAAYVLGFLGFSAKPLVESSVPLEAWQRALEACTAIAPYFFISISYAYATAALYLSYHAAILTMPTLPLQRLRYDFALALFEAIGFGYSMCFPMMFPFLLGFTFLAALFRQEIEHLHLATRLSQIYGREVKVELDRNEDVRLKENKSFKKDLIALLGQPKFDELSGWNRADPGHFLATLVVMVISAALWYERGALRIPQAYLLAGEGLVLAAVVCLVAHGLLRKRATFLYEAQSGQTKMDSQFAELIRVLEIRRTNADYHP